MTRPVSGKKSVRPRNAAAKTREKEHFALGLLARGEAVPEPSPGKELPADATHTIERGAAKGGAAPPADALHRRRFSLR